MNPHYKHTQVGWIMIGAMVLLIATQAQLLRLPAAAAALTVIALVLALFASLTVEVDAEEIRVRFTGGLIRRRIPLREVTGWRAVRNHWLSGWGIRKVSGGWLWNVSGLDAVELALRNGRRFRIGTDEPAALAEAIERVAGPTAAPAGEPAREGRAPLVALVTILAVVVVAIAVAWRLQTKPPEVRLAKGEVRIRSLFYGASFATNEIVGLTIENELPRVLARTNGFAGGRSLRGWFSVDGLGRGQLFLERDSPPYLVLRLRSGFVIVGFGRPERTRALFDELQQARGARP